MVRQTLLAVFAAVVCSTAPFAGATPFVPLASGPTPSYEVGSDLALSWAGKNEGVIYRNVSTSSLWLWDVVSGQHADLKIDASACSAVERLAYCEAKLPLPFPPFVEDRLVELDAVGVVVSLLPPHGVRPFVNMSPFMAWDYQGQVGAYRYGDQSLHFPLAGGGASRPVVLENFLVYQRDLGPTGPGGLQRWELESFDLGASPMSVLSSVVLLQDNPPRPAVFLGEVWYEGADSGFLGRRWTNVLPNLMSTYNFGGICKAYRHPTIGVGVSFVAFQGTDCKDGDSVLYVYDVATGTLYQAGELWNASGDKPAFSVRGKSIAFADKAEEMWFITVDLP
jgi:hypothetical protein